MQFMTNNNYINTARPAGGVCGVCVCVCVWRGGDVCAFAGILYNQYGNAILLHAVCIHYVCVPPLYC